MKKLMMMVAVVLLLCLPAQGKIYSWLWADNDALGVRIGTDLEKIGVDIDEKIEVGISALWYPDQDSPKMWGIYGIYHLPEIVQFRNPLVLDFLPEEIGGRPYFGGKVEIDFDIDKSSVSPIAGIVFEDIFFIEYQFDSFDRQRNGDSKAIWFGLRIKW